MGIRDETRMKAVVRELPPAIPGKERGALDDAAKAVTEDLRDRLADLVVTPDHESYTLVLETSTYLGDSEVMQAIGDYFSGFEPPIRVDVLGETPLTIVCC